MTRVCFVVQNSFITNLAISSLDIFIFNGGWYFIFESRYTVFMMNKTIDGYQL